VVAGTVFGAPVVAGTVFGAPVVAGPVVGAGAGLVAGALDVAPPPKVGRLGRPPKMLGFGRIIDRPPKMLGLGRLLGRRPPNRPPKSGFTTCAASFDLTTAASSP